MTDKVWTQSGKETLTSEGDLLDPTLSLIDELFEAITNQIANNGNTRAEWRFNSLATAIYATRFNQNGAGDASGASQTNGVLGNTSANDEDNFCWFYFNNIASREKMLLSRVMDAGGPTAASAPQRIKGWSKAANTVALTSMQVQNLFGAGDFGIGSNMQVATAVPAVAPILGDGSWIELGRTTLGGTGDNVTVSGLPNKRYYQLLQFTPSTGNMNVGLQFGNGGIDSGTNYASRRQQNGAATTTNVNTNRIVWQASVTSAQQRYGCHFVSNLQTRVKLHNGYDMRTVTGTATGPTRTQIAGKWQNTVDPIDTINMVNVNGSGDFQAGTQLVVLGWDPTDTHSPTANFWKPLADVSGDGTPNMNTGTFDAKRYLWVQAYLEPDALYNPVWTFNQVVTSTYGNRDSINGGVDTASGPNPFFKAGGSRADPMFINMYFLNILDRQKLGFTSSSEQETAGAGTAPSRRETAVEWTDTTQQVTRIDVNPFTGSPNLSSNSYIRVWGND